MTARPLMVCGTSSHVGKSLLVAGLCRILHQDGVDVAPFKSQNMSNNAAVCDGGEIGRAQALQARAARIPASVDMNPILLKPEGEARSQVVVAGRPVGTMEVEEYHRYKETDGRRIVTEHYRRLAARHDVVVIEGAGSPVEINLKQHDLANLWVAEMADAPVVLVGDIDRGGVLAALAGTLELMAPAERARVKGYVINKFRGRRGLLDPGLSFLTDRYGVPCLGVVPYLSHALPEEDGVAAEAGVSRGSGRLRVGVVRLPRLANFTDFDPFAMEPDVTLSYLDHPQEVAAQDLLILPGSKATLADLAWLRRRGLDVAVRDFALGGGPVVGICGGYQMLGTTIADPGGVEGGGRADGLGLLDGRTILAAEKRCVEVTYTPTPDAGLGNTPVTGYEIHMGTTAPGKDAPLFADASEGTGQRRGNVWGAYLHGLFDNDAARQALLGPIRRERCLPEPPPVAFQERVDGSLDHWADTVRKHLDMGAVRALL